MPVLANGDGWGLVAPAAFKAVVRRAERLGCVRFARISATAVFNPSPHAPLDKRMPAAEPSVELCFAGMITKKKGVHSLLAALAQL